MPNSWDGQERRKDVIVDHDLLIKIDTNLMHLIDSYANHVQDDKKSFDKIDKRMDIAEKLLYGCVGIFVFVQLIIKVIK